MHHLRATVPGVLMGGGVIPADGGRVRPLGMAFNPAGRHEAGTTRAPRAPSHAPTTVPRAPAQAQGHEAGPGTGVGPGLSRPTGAGTPLGHGLPLRWPA